MSVKHTVVAAAGDTVEVFWQRSTQTIAQLLVGPPRVVADAALLHALLEAYRQKRAVDGLNRRTWDATVHWRAEQQIDQLERDLAALAPEHRLADAETPP
jgi:hypothetical protein